ncbi:MAG: twin-arginine translocase subunit TatB, partial [Lysobacter sp.]|nr:twin-arginine translocase subunit TatB [Lysobacter sp.]
LWVRRARAQWYSVKSELERELAAEELQRSLRDGRDALRDVETSIRDTNAEVRREFDALRGDVERDAAAEPPTSGVDADATPDAQVALETAETSPATAQEPADVGR